MGSPVGGGLSSMLNVEAWLSQTEPKSSAEYSADVQRQPNFGAPLS